MCGATQAQTDLQTQQADFYKQMTDAYKTQFGNSQSILNALTKQYMPILQAGPNQAGYSPQELEALQTEAITGTATNYAQASRALQESQAATTGSEFLPAGATVQAQQQLASQAAAAKSAQMTGITQASYEQGRQNWLAATNELNTATQLYNPLGYAGEATGAGHEAASTANQIAQASNSIWGSVLGALGGVAGMAVGGPSGLLKNFKMPWGGGAGGATGAGGAPQINYGATY